MEAPKERDSRVPTPLTVREALRLLRRDGWTQERQRGGHRQLKHPSKPGTVTVAGAPNEAVDVGTLRNIFRQAGLPWPPAARSKKK